MDFVAYKSALLKLLERCRSCADKKAAQPVLANILLEAYDREKPDGTGSVRATASNLYLSMTGTAEAEVVIPGSFALPAGDLYERVKAMPDGPIQVAVSDGRQATLRAVGKPRRYHLSGLPGGDYPTPPRPAGRSYELAVDVLSLLIERTHFSAATDETRAIVNSALFEWEGDRVRMVTTDGHRLSKMDAVVHGSNGDMSLLIPLRALQEIRDLLDYAKAEKVGVVTIHRGGPCAFFTVAGMQFATKLVDADYVNYELVIPKTVEDVARIPRLPFIDALKAMKIASPTIAPAVEIELVPGLAKLTSTSPENGAAGDEIPIEYSGPAATRRLNANYACSVLGVIGDEFVSFGITDELGPMVIRPDTETADYDYIAIIMGMRP